MKLLASLLLGAALVAGNPLAQAADAMAGLPLVEVPARSAAGADSLHLAVILSGDGGWANLDRRIAASFATRGIPVIGIDSLRYYWHARTPEEAARDVAAVINHYLVAWHRERVDLVGYSFGADVLPFIANRLPESVASHVASVSLVAPSDSAIFEIHISNWLPGVVSSGLPLAPELARLKGPLLCLHGVDDDESVCAAQPHAAIARIGRGHHLDGDGESIVERILASAQVVPGA